MWRTRRKRWRLCYSLVILLSLAWLVNGKSREKKKKNVVKKKKKEYPDYIYGPNAGLVKEFNRTLDRNPEHPDFLFAANNGPRVVEFYSPVCPHCRNFRNNYVELAEKVNRIAREQGVGNDEAVPIAFHAISCRPNHVLCKSFSLRYFPHIKLFPANATANNSIELPIDKIHPLHMLKLLDVQANDLKLDKVKRKKKKRKQDESNTDSAYNVALRTVQSWWSSSTSESQPTTTTSTRGAGGDSAWSTNNFNRTKTEIFDDAYRSLDYTLRSDIFASNGPLPNDAKLAFRHFLELLQKSTPRASEMQRIAEALLADFDQVTSGEDKLLAILDDDDKFEPPVSEWSTGCVKGDVGMGFTCGMWSLFHIASVGMVEWNVLLPASTARVQSLSIPANRAADTLRDFIYHFFSCQECRNHFVQEYDACSLDRCNRLSDLNMKRHWKRFPTWLNEVHNTVNVRLLHERAARENRTVTPEDETNKRWPHVQNCPKCWKEDGSRDDEMIYKYLRVEYWLEDSTAAEYRKELGLPELIRIHVEREETAPDASLPAQPFMLSKIGLPTILVLFAAIGAWKHRQKKSVNRRKGFQKRQSSEDQLDLGDVWKEFDDEDDGDAKATESKFIPRGSQRRRILRPRAINGTDESTADSMPFVSISRSNSGDSSAAGSSP